MFAEATEALGSGQAREQGCHPAQREAVDGRAASVHADLRPVDARRRPNRSHDLALERVGRPEVAVELETRTLAGDEHPGVLARAVVIDATGPGGAPAGLALDREVRRAPEVAFGAVADAQEPPNGPNVHGLTVVRSTHDRDEILGQRFGDPPEGDRRLERLHRRARENETIRIAQ
jgi:hypothetical protein